MSAINVTLVGKEAVLGKFRERREKVGAAIYKAMGREMSKLAEYVRTSKLSGQVLKNRTGTLRRSIHAMATREEGVISGQVGTNVEYAHVHEHGFHGPVQVREHERHNKSSLKAKRAGNTARRAGNAQRFVQARLNEASAISTVHAHTRQMNMPERAFLRPSLTERRQAVIDALRQSVVTVMQKP